MGYKKLTKAQWKAREHILAWLEGKPFRENSRSKLAVPELTVEDVLEQYVPPDVTGAGQYFTPPEMARHLLSYLDIPWYGGDGYSVLDPCAGVGHLLWPLIDTDIELVAYELEEECVKIGRKLFPDVEWYWEIPSDHMDKLEGRFSCVVLNPPFNTRRGIVPLQEMARGVCTKSEHVFFALAVRACMPNGQIAVIAPYNFMDRWPKSFQAWLEDKVELLIDLGQLPGEFALGGISVNGFIFRRLSVRAELEPAKEGRQAEWHERPTLASIPARAPMAIHEQLPLF